MEPEAAQVDVFAAFDHTGSDKTLYDKMVKALASHAHFAATTDRTAGSTASPATGGGLFTIKHYAGDVTYSPAHLLEKNKDQLYRDLIDTCGASSQPFVAGLFPEAREKAGTQRRPVTAGSQFRTQINALIDTLLQCEPHYIRCIKPNDAKRAGVLALERVRHQVRYLGLLIRLPLGADTPPCPTRCATSACSRTCASAAPALPSGRPSSAFRRGTSCCARPRGRRARATPRRTRRPS